MVKKKFKLGSLVTGIALGLFMGYWLNIVLSKTSFIVPFPLLTYSIISVLVFGILGFYLQRTTEIIGYALSAFIIFQFTWDVGVEMVIGPVRMGLLWRALVLLLINSFSGHFGAIKARTIMLRGVGIK